MKWIPCTSTERPADDSWSHDPMVYVVRFKGDDPRSGWVDVKLLTAEQIQNINYPDYWEWLRPA